jgi:hypothetical protein
MVPALDPQLIMLCIRPEGLDASLRRPDAGGISPAWTFSEPPNRDY